MCKKKLWTCRLCKTIKNFSKLKVKSKNSKRESYRAETFEFNEEEKQYNIRHRCYYFSKEIVLFVKDCKYDKIYSSLFDQLIRSATSIGANMVESTAGSPKKDWKKFHIIALKSANEAKYWLCLIRDSLEADRSKISGVVKRGRRNFKDHRNNYY